MVWGGNCMFAFISPSPKVSFNVVVHRMTVWEVLEFERVFVC